MGFVDAVNHSRQILKFVKCHIASESERHMKMSIVKFVKTTVRNLVFVLVMLVTFVMFINYIESDLDRPIIIEVSAPVGGVNSSRRTIIILLWNKFFNGYNYMYGGKGSRFAGCPAENCIATSDRTLRLVEDYDAVVFHAWQFRRRSAPRKRSPGQFYTYLSMESPDTFKINSSFDNFFNWTVSYRSDSDFFWPYYRLKDNYGDVISPSKKPNWDKYYLASNKGLVPTFAKKKKMVAWFVSNCQAHNSRANYVKELQKYIEVDIYGHCGSFDCPKKDENACLEMVRSDYFFYIAFENSHCMEYMTEKAYRALLHDTIPLVFGRANYTNFIPPHSYLDANVMAPREMASVMNRLASDPDGYAAYFWWKGQFTFHPASEPSMHPFCEMCKTLRKPNLKPKIYENFVHWWETLPGSSEPACIRPKIKTF